MKLQEEKKREREREIENKYKKCSQFNFDWNVLKINKIKTITLLL